MCYTVLSMKKRKILIISVSAGAGHVRAAEALDQTARQFFPELETRHIDMMDYVSGAMRTAIVDVYDMLAKTLPDVWGFIYKTANETKTMKRFYRLIRSVNRLNARKLYAFLEEYQPDEVICTHSFPAQVISQSSSWRHRGIPLNIVVTDYGFHKFWYIEGAQRYFVGSEKNKWELVREGVPEKSVFVSGIPVMPQFFQSEVSSLSEQVAKGLHVLVLAGGQGFIRSDEIVRFLVDNWNQPAALHITAVAGTNTKLLSKIKKIEQNTPTHIHLDVIGWTDQIDTYMKQADVVVTKAGGITTTEVITLGKRLVVIFQIPGKEEENARFVLESGAGMVARSLPELLYYLTHIGTVPHATPIKNLQDGGAYKVLRIIEG